MDVLAFAVPFLLAIFLGYCMGLLQKGIHIHHQHQNDLPPEADHTESLADMIDPEMRQYFDQHNGMEVK